MPTSGGHEAVSVPRSRYAAFAKSAVRLAIGMADGCGDGARNEPLVALLAEARRAQEDVLASPELTIAETARATGRCRKRLTRLLRVATLAPDIVERCLSGAQPAQPSTAMLLATPMPIVWSEQRKTLGIS